MHNEYLKKYGDRYRIYQNEDMIWEIATRHKFDEWGMGYSVYQFSDTHLAAMLPQKTGLSLSRRFPEIFRIHQHAQDGVSLVFEESRLHEVAGALGIRRKRKGPEMSEERRQEFIEGGKKFWTAKGTQVGQTGFKPTISQNTPSDTPSDVEAPK